jgi:hypothetical protein
MQVIDEIDINYKSRSSKIYLFNITLFSEEYIICGKNECVTWNIFL